MVLSQTDKNLVHISGEWSVRKGASGVRPITCSRKCTTNASGGGERDMKGIRRLRADATSKRRLCLLMEFCSECERETTQAPEDCSSSVRRVGGECEVLVGA